MERRHHNAPRREKSPHPRYQQRQRNRRVDRDRSQDDKPSSAQSYLQRWLDDTAPSVPAPPSPLVAARPCDDPPRPRSPTRWHPHNLAEVSINADARPHPEKRKECRKRKAPASASSNASISYSAHRQDRRRCENPGCFVESRLSHGAGGHNSSNAAAQPVFQRRRRHKTKEDRYQPKDRKKERSIHKKKRKERQNLVPSGELTEKFTSDAIHQDRVTVRM